MPVESRTPRSGALDAALGDRIRRRRRDMGLSQSALGGRLGITFQQVQKYENGANRVSATMLIRLSQALAMPVSELLAEINPGAPRPDLEEQSGQLAAAFARIDSAEVRAAVVTLVEALAPR
jgi:transcriptional regulator with XRE-family HTH domain